MITATLIIKSLLILLFVSLTAFIFNRAESYHANKKVPIPFKESMDLLNVPVVTFTNNNVKLHFLLDTGSDSSFIKKEVLEVLNIKSRDNSVAFINTGGGEAQSEGTVTLDIFYKDQRFENTFEIANMAGVWDEATKGTGITIHGILGSIFFSNYKYQIDFDELIAYSKR